MPIIVFILLLILAPFVYFIGFNNIKPSELLGLSLDIQSPEIGMVLKGVHLVEKKGNETMVDLFSTQAVISKESDLITMVNVDAKIQKADQVPSRVTADTGKYMKVKNELILKGHTEVKLENGTNLKTDTLYWDGFKNEFTTDDFVEIKGENFLLTGTGMIFKSEPQDIELKTNVSASIY